MKIESALTPSASLIQKDAQGYFWVCFGLFCLIFFAIYLPIIVLPVLTGDDFNYYIYWNRVLEKCPSCWTFHTHHWLADSFLFMGRPFANPLHCFTLRQIRDLSHYPLMRSVSVVLAAFMAALFALRLHGRFKMEKRLSFLTSFLIFTLPGMMFYVTYYSFSLSFLIALLLAAMSVESIERIQFEKGRLTNTVNIRSVFFFLLSWAALVTSLLIYQPSAVFFVTYTATWFLFTTAEEWPKARRALIRNLGFFIFSVTGYFVLCKFILLPYFASQHPVSAKDVLISDYRFSLAHHLSDKIVHFKNITLTAMSLWNMFPHKSIARWVGGILILGLLIAGFKRWRTTRRLLPALWFYIQAGMSLMILCLLANAQNFSSGGIVSNRQIFPYTALVGLFFSASLIQLASLWKKQARQLSFLALLFFSLVSGFSTYDRVLRWITVNHYLENRFVQHKLAYYIKQQNIIPEMKNHVHVVMPPWGKSFIGLPFGVNDEIYSASARVDKVPGLIHFNLVQLGLKLDEVAIPDEDYGFGPPKGQSLQLEVTRSPAVQYQATVINMNDLLLGSKKIILQDFSTVSVASGEIAKITESSFGTGHYGARAFDESTYPDDFWEAGKYPQWLQVEYLNEKKIKGYIFETGFSAEDRMPQSWTLEGSTDALRWEKLDERNNEMNWPPDGKRVYSIMKPSFYRFYRFDFVKGNAPNIIRIYEIRMLV